MFCPFPPHTRLTTMLETGIPALFAMPNATLLVAVALVAAAVVLVAIFAKAVRRVQVVTAAAVSAAVPAAAWGLGSDQVAPATLYAAGRGAGGALMIAASCALLWAAYRIGRRY